VSSDTSSGTWLRIDESVDKKGNGFPGFFRIGSAIDTELPPALRELMRYLNLAIDALDATESPKNKVYIHKEARLRDAYGRRLRLIANYVTRVPVGDINLSELYPRAMNDLGEAYGRYAEGCSRFSTREFAIVDPPDKPATIQLTLPDGGTAIQQTLLVEILRTVTVVDIVLERKARKSALGLWIATRWRKSTDRAGISPTHPTEGVRSSYLLELRDIANTGLASEEGTAYAQLRLEAFREGFVAHEADAVKNQHVRNLGFWSFAFCAILLASATCLQIGYDLSWSDSNNHFCLLRNFLLLSSAAAVGTWLSFSLRRVQIGFDDRCRWRSSRGTIAILGERFARKQNFVFLAGIGWSGRTRLALGPAIFETRLASAIVEAATWRAAAIVAIVAIAIAA